MENGAFLVSFCNQFDVGYDARRFRKIAPSMTTIINKSLECWTWSLASPCHTRISRFQLLFKRPVQISISIVFLFLLGMEFVGVLEALVQ